MRDPGKRVVVPGWWVSLAERGGRWREDLRSLSENDDNRDASEALTLSNPPGRSKDRKVSEANPRSVVR
jgi:hypothetical protein